MTVWWHVCWPFDFDIGVLAGYMLITTKELCDRYPLLNLHPAAPKGPEGVWQDVIRHLIRGRAGYSGIQIQRVTSSVDRGPLVSFCTYPIQGAGIDSLWPETVPNDEQIGEDSALFQEIRRRGMIREAPLMAETLRSIGDGGLARLLDDSCAPPIDLTESVERIVADDSAP
jgi:phosphoribosylglycinamide formyltransferase 1